MKSSNKYMYHYQYVIQFVLFMLYNFIKVKYIRDFRCKDIPKDPLLDTFETAMSTMHLNQQLIILWLSCFYESAILSCHVKYFRWRWFVRIRRWKWCHRMQSSLRGSRYVFLAQLHWRRRRCYCIIHNLIALLLLLMLFETLFHCLRGEIFWLNRRWCGSTPMLMHS